MKLKERQNDPRYLKVMGFLVAKDLIKTNQENIVPLAKIKLNLKDVLWAANNVEPRIFEVLPAAILHFPKTFRETNRIPKDLIQIIDRIERLEKHGPDYKGIRYKDMYRWANLELNDQRTKPLTEKRILKTFRLQPKVIEKLKTASMKSGKSQTDFLEKLILSNKI